MSFNLDNRSQALDPYAQWAIARGESPAELGPEPVPWKSLATKSRVTLRQLLGPLVPAAFRDAKGELDLSKIPAINFTAFKSFLVDQVKIDGVSFNEYCFASYHRILDTEKYGPLLKLLWDESASINPNTNLKVLLNQFLVDIVDVSPERFVSRNFATAAGRKRLERILQEKNHFSHDLRTDLVKAIATVGEQQGYAGLHGHQLEKQISTLNWFNIGVTNTELRHATHHAQQIIQTVAEQKIETKQIRSRHQGEGKQISLLSIPVARDFKKITQLIANNQNKLDPKSQLQTKLARLWLLAADNANWRQSNFLGSSRHRGLIIRETEGLLQEAKKITTEADFLRLNEKVQHFLETDLKIRDKLAWKESQWALKLVDHFESYRLGEIFQEMPEEVKEPFSDLKQFSDKLHYASENGQKIVLATLPLKAKDPKLQDALTQLIPGLQDQVYQLWYDYQQHGALSRAGSWFLDQMGISQGDKSQIRKAIQAINQFITKLMQVENTETFKKIVQGLYQQFQAGEAIYEGMTAAESDGIEQMVSLLQTTVVILGTTFILRGVGTAGAVAQAARIVTGAKQMHRVAAGLRTMEQFRKVHHTYQQAKAAKVLGTSLQTLHGTRSVTATGQLAARIRYGMGMGTWLSITENAIARASGQVSDEMRVGVWGKDAMATGLAMGIFSPLAMGLGQGVYRGFFRGLVTRYGKLPQGALRFGADTALEGAEELFDAGLRQAFAGKGIRLSQEQAREITLVTSFGGGFKMGAVAQSFRSYQDNLYSKNEPTIARASRPAPGSLNANSVDEHKPLDPIAADWVASGALGYRAGLETFAIAPLTPLLAQWPYEDHTGLNSLGVLLLGIFGASVTFKGFKQKRKLATLIQELRASEANFIDFLKNNNASVRKIPLTEVFAQSEREGFRASEKIQDWLAAQAPKDKHIFEVHIPTPENGFKYDSSLLDESLDLWETLSIFYEHELEIAPRSLFVNDPKTQIFRPLPPALILQLPNILYGDQAVTHYKTEQLSTFREIIAQDDRPLLMPATPTEVDAYFVTPYLATFHDAFHAQFLSRFPKTFRTALRTIGQSLATLGHQANDDNLLGSIIDGFHDANLNDMTKAFDSLGRYFKDSVQILSFYSVLMLKLESNPYRELFSQAYRQAFPIIFSESTPEQASPMELPEQVHKIITKLPFRGWGGPLPKQDILQNDFDNYWIHTTQEFGFAANDIQEAVAFWDIFLQYFGYQNLEHALLIHHGYTASSWLPKEYRKHQIAKARGLEGNPIAKQTQALELLEQGLKKRLKASNYSSEEKIQLGYEWAEQHWLHPEWNGQLKVDDFKKTKPPSQFTGLIGNIFHYVLSPDRAKSIALKQLSNSRYHDPFPEWTISPQDLPGLTIPRLQTFFGSLQQADHLFRDGGKEIVHCDESAQLVAYLLRKKGFHPITLWLQQLIPQDSELSMEALIRPIHKLSLITKQRGSDLIREITTPPVSSELQAAIGKLPPKERAVLQNKFQTRSHMVTAVMINGEYFLIDINRQQFDLDKSAILITPESKAASHGLYLDESLAGFYQKAHPLEFFHFLNADVEAQLSIVQMYLSLPEFQPAH